MFHFEDTSRIDEAESSEDRLIILDGTVRLDYLENLLDGQERKNPDVWSRLRKLFD